jgi:hypothetical protein
MVKLFTKDPYPYIIDFIDAVVDSEEISLWLAALESEPDNMRIIRLAEIKNRMEYNNAPEQHIEIIELMNNKNLLQAMNNVIKDVHLSGLKTKNHIKKKDDTNYNILISLIASTSES